MRFRLNMVSTDTMRKSDTLWSCEDRPLIEMAIILRSHVIIVFCPLFQFKFKEYTYEYGNETIKKMHHYKHWRQIKTINAFVMNNSRRFFESLKHESPTQKFIIENGFCVVISLNVFDGQHSKCVECRIVPVDG